MTWDTTLPLGTEAISNGDDRIRELKVDLQTSLRANAADGTEAKFPGSDTTNPIYRYRGLKDTTGLRPVAGQYGLFFDTTRNGLQRDNGASWDDIGTMIPATTKAVFFQASAPTGWTKDTAHDGKVLRVVSGSGGGSGGTHDPATAITLAHTHTVNSHTHTIAADGSHTHTLTAAGGGAFVAGSGVIATANGDHDHGGVTGSTSPGTDSQLSNVSLAYINVIVCTKD